MFCIQFIIVIGAAGQEGGKLVPTIAVVFN
jgi:hypothetical protein